MVYFNHPFFLVESPWFGGENLFEHLPESVTDFHITQAAVGSARQTKSPPPSVDIVGGAQNESSAEEESGINAIPLSEESLIGPLSTWWQK